MHRIRTLRIGQVIGLGFGLVLLVALLVALLGRVAYDVSSVQRNTIQNRSEVERLTLELELLSIQRTDVLDKYLVSGTVSLLATYQTHQSAYADTASRLAALLHTHQETQALQAVTLAESELNDKAQEVFRLFNGGFRVSARSVWRNEGTVIQDNLLEKIGGLRRVQGNTSKVIINRARSTEEWTINTISIFIPLVLIGAIVVGWLITRNINNPISHLVETVGSMSSDLSTRVEPSGPREIAFLGETINKMAISLSDSEQSLQAHKERMESELTLASQIQASFLPHTLPNLSSLELATFRQSAREVGGDFFTFIGLGAGRQGIAVGDASGKGAPAAMASALAVGLLDAYAPTLLSPEKLLAKLNNDLYLRFSSNQMNVACCYMIFDETTSCLTVANAGCVYPYLRRGPNVVEIDVYGMPLGMWPNFNYLSQSCKLRPVDLLLLGSDGLIEAKNKEGEMFGFERLEAELLNLSLDADAQTTVNELLDTVMSFTATAELHDDLTLVVARVAG